MIKFRKKSTRHSAGRKCIVKQFKSKLKTASDGKITTITANYNLTPLISTTQSRSVSKLVTNEVRFVEIKTFINLSY